MEEGKFFVRKKFVVDRQFQLQYLKIFVITSLSVLIIGAGLYYMTRANMDVREETRLLVLKVLGLMSVFVMLYSALMGVLCVALTHRVAGAAWRLEQHLHKIREGSYDEIVKLRKDDYLKNLAAGLNELSALLREDVARRQEAVRNLETLKSVFEKDGPSSEAHRQTLTDVIQALRPADQPVGNVSKS